MQLIYDLFECLLNHVIPVWGSTSQTYLDKLISYQNEAVKIITKAIWNDSLSYLLSDVSVLKLAKIYQLKVAKIMHCIDQQKYSISLVKYF